MIKLKRAYEPASKDDGLRILVERLWPRGVSKRKAAIDSLAERPPSHHETPQVVRPRPGPVAGVSEAVLGRIERPGWFPGILKYLTGERTVRFVYAASDEERNSAVALKEFQERGKK